MKENEKFYTKKTTLNSLAIGLFLLICFTYSNHFTNGFHFDDGHTITSNSYITDIKNIPLFFTDIKYYGTNPGNQGYNPILVTLNTIDYWLAGGLNPVYFHVSIFISYIFLLVLLFFLIKKILDVSFENKTTNAFASLLAVGFYGLHTANAETINYIIMRSDSFSTLCIIASLLLYINPFAKKYYLYLITLALAIGTKETGVMFAPILFFYILFFEENTSLIDLFNFKKITSSISAFKKSFFAIVLSFFSIYLIIKLFYAPAKTLTAQEIAPVSVWQYFYTQWVVISHYIGNFILPLDLSADPDFELIDSVINRKVLLGLALLLTMVTIAIFTSRKKETRPIAYGILWFFIALAPTSSFLPIGQISNDHRTFFPYIGLVISLTCWLSLLYKKYQIQNNVVLNKILFLVYFVIISLHAYGTHQRNKTWSSDELLWYDVTIKSPKNGRGQMNYGLALMEQGKYNDALVYFKRALDRLPNWAYIHINMAILRDAMGFPDEAEQYFKNAIRVQPHNPNGYYYYARWLNNVGRSNEAIDKLNEGIKISPGHTLTIDLLNTIKPNTNSTKESDLTDIISKAEKEPSVINYINLSLSYYKNGKLLECVEACKKVLEIDPKNAIAYNNMCSAYNELKQYEKAVEACNKALEIDSNFERAKNNLNFAKNSLK